MGRRCPGSFVVPVPAGGSGPGRGLLDALAKGVVP